MTGRKVTTGSNGANFAILLSTFEKLIQMSSEVTIKLGVVAEKNSETCTVVRENTAAVKDLISVLHAVPGQLRQNSRVLKIIQYAMIPVILSLVATIFAMILRHV